MKIDLQQIKQASGANELNLCPACGARFTCGMNAGAASCWCAALPPVLPVPGAALVGAQDACLCPDCLKLRIDAQTKNA